MKAENARLTALLESHGIEWRQSTEPSPTIREPEPIRLSAAEKIALFRKLFRGRTDVYPVRWEGKTPDRSGYAPACANDRFTRRKHSRSKPTQGPRIIGSLSEPQAVICRKPTIKCGDCGNRDLIPLSDDVIYKHLSGAHTVGVYPLLEDDSCYFLAVDFDQEDWRDDARAFMESCHELGIPGALEISRSGRGAHVWIFFSGRVPARDARQLGSAIVSYTCSRTRQLELTSYDRMFPSQDTMPNGGFGNLIALPLQRAPRDNGCMAGATPGFPRHRHRRHRHHRWR
ncbi:TOTE conflict system archaeo-eukaryotic primase domain-containing protein [Thioalkalivibrio paradoxus]|uniref:TOTE conflict system archaeo-eukaryotic primase domain-containing protein n=1 Tax=Thioalkalivibrio paradoxus TaxID=108010 RepID=UPI001E593F56|nr:DNA primase small subunit domain-containing protein [Thioalkalivibrio paradoxus]